MQLTKNFSSSELECRHCNECKMDESFMEWLQALRTVYCKPITISSGYRCPEYNDRVSSTGLEGPHTTGKAVDIAVDREEASVLLELAYKLGVKGVGINQKGSNRFLHFDLLDEGRPTIWSY